MINVRNAADFGINREIAVVRNVVERNVNDYVNALVLGCGAEILELILCTELVADFVARGLIELIPLADSCLAFADNACDRTGLDGCVACRRDIVELADNLAERPVPAVQDNLLAA